MQPPVQLGKPFQIQERARDSRNFWQDSYRDALSALVWCPTPGGTLSQPLAPISSSAATFLKKLQGLIPSVLSVKRYEKMNSFNIFNKNEAWEEINIHLISFGYLGDIWRYFGRLLDPLVCKNNKHVAWLLPRKCMKSPFASEHNLKVPSQISQLLCRGLLGLWVIWAMAI